MSQKRVVMSEFKPRCGFPGVAAVAALRLGFVAMVAATGWAVLQAYAGFVLPGDSQNFAVLYEGNGGNTLNFNNSQITGDIGIGSTGKFAGNGPGTITGTVKFSAANTGQFSNSGLTITGGAAYSQPDVLPDLTPLNTLSHDLGLEAGTATTINSGGSVSAAAARWTAVATAYSR
jgi:hypothetical protein